MNNSPNNESEYDQLLERIVKGAEYLENPFIKSEDFDKGIRLYEKLCDVAREYRMKTQEASETVWNRSIA